MMDLAQCSMDLDAHVPAGSRKRGASAISPLPPPASDENTPRVLYRYHHRRENIAADIWGEDIPLKSEPGTFTFQQQRPASAPFNIYKALLRHPNLFFQFTLRLPLTCAVSLYAIDKEFHYLFNKYSVSILHDYARYWAPVSSHIFTWVLFPSLCISDPMLRPMNDRTWLARDVPSWRWVSMVLYRQSVVRGILSSLEFEGCGQLPARTESVVCKFWLLTEFPHAHLRASFLQDTSIWSDEDILVFQLFLIKLDMRLSHPVIGNSACSLSHLLLSQKTLTHLYTLTCTKNFKYESIIPLMITTYPIDSFDLDEFPWLDDEEATGVDEEEWGILSKEGWDEDGEEMMLAVDCVVCEGLRRELHIQKWLLDFVMSGYESRSGGVIMRKWRNGERCYEGWLSGKERDSVMKQLDVRFGLVQKYKGGDKMDVGT